MPSMIRNRYGACAVSPCSNAILVFGGYDYGVHLYSGERFDAVRGVWRSISPMTQSRAGALAVLLPDSSVMILGGFCQGPLSSVEVYDPSSDSWHDGVRMPRPRWHSAATLVEDRLYVVGGQEAHSDSDALSDIFCFDLHCSSWSVFCACTGSSLHTARYSHSTVSFFFDE